MKAVILAGGNGTRLWPLSTKNKPKQLQSLISEKTLLEETINRLNFLEPKDIFIATNQDYIEEVKKIAKQIPPRNFIPEPACRDTAPCIGLAAAYIAKLSSPEEVMAVVYADQLVQNPELFASKLKTAVKIAEEENTLNIIEVKAQYPNTNLGYVKIGEVVNEIDGSEIFTFEKFIEKPDLQTAQKLVADGHYLWNTGFYVWKVSKILKEFHKHAPSIYEHLSKIQAAINTPEEIKVLNEEYKKCEKISIDYAIMEKTDPKNVRIIAADLKWSDIGTWNAIHDELTTNEEENIIKGVHVGHDTKGSLIYGTTGKPIITLGLKNMIIVETNEAILVCPREKSHEIKKVIDKLQTSHNHLL